MWAEIVKWALRMVPTATSVHSGAGVGWRFLGRPINTKVLVYLTDVGPDDDCTGCVPGSHLWDHEPDHLEFKGMGGGESQATKVRDQRDMPGMVAAEVKAGSAFFNTRLWHTTLPNTGKRDRWAVLTLYCPFYQKQPGVTLEAAVALEAAGQLNTLERRQLFGLELMSTGTNPYKRLAQHNGSLTDDRMFKGVRPPVMGKGVK